MEDSSLEDMIEKVRQQSIRFGCPLPPPSPESEIADLPGKVEAELHATVPGRYLDLLRVTNGFDEGGLGVFSSRTLRNPASDVLGRELRIWGIVEANQEIFRANRESFEQLLIFAEAHPYLYAQVIETGAFIMFLNAEEEVCAEYETFDEMMVAAIQEALID